MAFAKAERTKLYLRCALFGPSGSGKSMTGLRMAKGIAEKMGVPFAVIDTESRSASKYADRFDFDVENLAAKTVDHYIAAMNEAERAGYKVLFIDSLSHAWRELAEEVDRITQSSASKNSVLSWAKFSPKQKRLINAILNYPGHLIITMRSKTEWVIGVGKDGKIAPEKMGLAPEQGKGIEYEFDLLMEMDQKHYATITKDRTGKFQDETIEKPGEDFGVALYEWLVSGKAEKPVAAIEGKTRPKPQKPAAAAPKPEKTRLPAPKPQTGKPSAQAKGQSLKEQGGELMKEIGAIITSAVNGKPYFTEEEKEEARQIIRATKLDEKGLTDLEHFKTFLNDERVKRESKKAA
jgi:hypothetical protein